MSVPPGPVRPASAPTRCRDTLESAGALIAEPVSGRFGGTGPAERAPPPPSIFALRAARRPSVRVRGDRRRGGAPTAAGCPDGPRGGLSRGTGPLCAAGQSNCSGEISMLRRRSKHSSRRTIWPSGVSTAPRRCPPAIGTACQPPRSRWTRAKASPALRLAPGGRPLPGGAGRPSLAPGWRLEIGCRTPGPHPGLVDRWGGPAPLSPPEVANCGVTRPVRPRRGFSGALRAALRRGPSPPGAAAGPRCH